MRIVEVYNGNRNEPCAPCGVPYRPRRWLNWTVPLTAILLAVMVLLVVAEFLAEPLKAVLRVAVVRHGTAELTVTQSLPLQAADRFVFRGELSRPNYAALFWIGSTGNVQLVVDRCRERIDTVRYPKEAQRGVPIVGPPGLEVIILVTSKTPLSAAQIVEQLVELGPPPSFRKKKEEKGKRKREEEKVTRKKR
jgi:hypothetical protein